jgi:hypothetical protein
MKDEAQDNNNFLSWAKKVCTESPETLEWMLKSHNALYRVIARRIKQIAGAEE